MPASGSTNVRTVTLSCAPRQATAASSAHTALGSARLYKRQERAAVPQVRTQLRSVGYGEVRAPNMMMAMPTKLTVTPIQSVAVGRMPSTAQSHRTATPI